MVKRKDVSEKDYGSGSDHDLRDDASASADELSDGDDHAGNINITQQPHPHADDIDIDNEEQPSNKPKKKKVRKLKLSATQDFNAKLQKRGIVYLSRVPPRMGPAKVKHSSPTLAPSHAYISSKKTRPGAKSDERPVGLVENDTPKDG